MEDLTYNICTCYSINILFESIVEELPHQVSFETAAIVTHGDEGTTNTARLALL